MKNVSSIIYSDALLGATSGQSIIDDQAGPDDAFRFIIWRMAAGEIFRTILEISAADRDVPCAGTAGEQRRCGDDALAPAHRNVR
ncbi:hypothetical protein [Burkholderia cenocepacia]|uniref:hypothetical protein n=1 Tax=Burkholderia cenocepacia TaxID=95486 RepID=UPI002865E502|nr:hypothetical protein [Burkholderia cenocepacia]MDR8071857.1 hypothetical protein [Burkholderia cenocepacia]